MRRAAITLCLLVPHASAQLALYTVQSGAETPVANGQFLQFGSIAAGWEAVDVALRLKYTGAQSPYYLTYFHLQDGMPFSMVRSDWNNTLPFAIPAAGLNFTVRFQPVLTGNYSPKLEIRGTQGVDDLTFFLVGTAYPGFTPSAASLNFGNVPVGSSQTQTLTLTNNNPGAPLTVDAISFQTGTNFHVSGNSPVGAAVIAGSSANIAIVFQPTAAGPYNDTLTIGLYSFPLAGVGSSPPPPPYPQPSIQVNLPTAASGQQGTISVSLAAASPADGNGTVTLAFQPAVSGAPDDPVISFPDLTRSATFSIAKGSSIAQFSGNANLGFQTGTTAGTLVFSVQLGSSSAQASVTIPAAVIGGNPPNPLVAMRNVACIRQDAYCNTANIQLEYVGWDNTRTASHAVFRFFDSSGQEISPGDITWNGAAQFQQYFAASTVGGTFKLVALFPISGDPNRVTSAEISITNTVGASAASKVEF